MNISLEDNTLLTSPFVIDEFKEAIFSMKPDKCSGPDGFNSGFFRNFGEVVEKKFFLNVVSGSRQVPFPLT